MTYSGTQGQSLTGTHLDVEGDGNVQGNLTVGTINGSTPISAAVTEITSTDLSVTVSNPTGPTVDLSVAVSPGILSHVQFPFAYDDANLNDGITCYTPTAGTWLYDAWIEVDTAWDGTTPIGNFGGTAYGLLFAGLTAGVNMSNPDTDGGNTGAPIAGASGNTSLNALSNTTGPRQIGKWTSTDPLKVWVSQDGTIGGTAPGASQGAAILHLIILTA